MLSWLIKLLPIIIGYIKEIIIPGTEHQKTSMGMRISILVIIILILMLAFVSETAFTLHSDKIRSDFEIKELKKDNAELIKEKTTLDNRIRYLEGFIARRNGAPDLRLVARREEDPTYDPPQKLEIVDSDRVEIKEKVEEILTEPPELPPTEEIVEEIVEETVLEQNPVGVSSRFAERMEMLKTINKY